jgi:hypothetical protein
MELFTVIVESFFITIGAVTSIKWCINTLFKLMATKELMDRGLF